MALSKDFDLLFGVDKHEIDLTPLQIDKQTENLSTDFKYLIGDITEEKFKAKEIPLSGEETSQIEMPELAVKPIEEETIKLADISPTGYETGREFAGVVTGRTPAAMAHRLLAGAKRAISESQKKVAPITLEPEKTAIAAEKTKEEARIHGLAAETLDPTWYNVEKYKEKLEEIRKNDPDIANSFAFGGVSAASDIAVFKAFLAGDQTAKDLALSNQKLVSKVAAERQEAQNEKKGIGGEISRVANSLAEMSNMLIKGATLNTVPIIGPIMSTSMWAMQGAGDIIAQSKEQGASDETALANGILGGLAYAGIEQLQLGHILNTGTRKVIEESIKKKIGKAIAEKGMDWAKETFLEEGLQGVIVEDAIISALNDCGVKVDDALKRKINAYKESVSGSWKEMGILSLLGLGAGVTKTIAEKGYKGKVTEDLNKIINAPEEETIEIKTSQEELPKENLVSIIPEDQKKEVAVEEKPPGTSIYDKKLSDFGINEEEFYSLDFRQQNIIFAQLSDDEKERIIRYEPEEHQERTIEEVREEIENVESEPGTIDQEPANERDTQRGKAEGTYTEAVQEQKEDEIEEVLPTKEDNAKGEMLAGQIPGVVFVGAGGALKQGDKIIADKLLYFNDEYNGGTTIAISINEDVNVLKSKVEKAREEFKKHEIKRKQIEESKQLIEEEEGVYDKENIARVSSEEQIGEEPVETEPHERRGKETVVTDRVLQEKKEISNVQIPEGVSTIADQLGLDYVRKIIVNTAATGVGKYQTENYYKYKTKDGIEVTIKPTDDIKTVEAFISRKRRDRDEEEKSVYGGNIAQDVETSKQAIKEEDKGYSLDGIKEEEWYNDGLNHEDEELLKQQTAESLNKISGDLSDIGIYRLIGEVDLLKNNIKKAKMLYDVASHKITGIFHKISKESFGKDYDARIVDENLRFFTKGGKDLDRARMDFINDNIGLLHELGIDESELETPQDFAEFIASIATKDNIKAMEKELKEKERELDEYFKYEQEKYEAMHRAKEEDFNKYINDVLNRVNIFDLADLANISVEKARNAIKNILENRETKNASRIKKIIKDYYDENISVDDVAKDIYRIRISKEEIPFASRGTISHGTINRDSAIEYANKYGLSYEGSYKGKRMFKHPKTNTLFLADNERDIRRAISDIGERVAPIYTVRAGEGIRFAKKDIIGLSKSIPEKRPTYNVSDKRQSVGENEKRQAVFVSRLEEEDEIQRAIYNSVDVEPPDKKVIFIKDGGPVQRVLLEFISNVTRDNVALVSVDEEQLEKDGISSFDGFRYRGKIYLNISGAIQRPLLWTAMHEWFHGLSKEDRDVIKEISKLTKEGRLAFNEIGEDEFFADIVGEILSSHDTLEYMAKQNPGGFKGIIIRLIRAINSVIKRFRNFIIKEGEKEYEKYIKNAEEVRDKLIEILQRKITSDAIKDETFKRADREAKQLRQEIIYSDKFKQWFGDWENNPKDASKVVDNQGRPLIVYSGHYNLELYGTEYNPKLSTAGGFYASEDKDIAAGYAMEKLGIKEYYENGEQYRFKFKNGKWGKKLWQMELTDEQLNKLKKTRNTKDDFGEDVWKLIDLEHFAKEHKDYDVLARRLYHTGILNNKAFALKNIYDFYEYMGYTISYQKEGANIIERQRPNLFERLLDELNIPWQSYEWASPGILPVYLNIRNPIDADKPFPKDLLEALKVAATKERDREDYYGNIWTKSYSLKAWIDNIEKDEDIWSTQIPQKALSIIKSFGYDGIKERGLKGIDKPREEKQINWIAFEPNQIKSAIGNRGTFSKETSDIRFAKREEDKKKRKEKIGIIPKAIPIPNKEDVKGAKEKVPENIEKIKAFEKEIKYLRKELKGLQENLLMQRADIGVKIKEATEEKLDLVKRSIYEYAKAIGLSGVPYNKVDLMLKNSKTSKNLSSAVEYLDKVWERFQQKATYQKVLSLVATEYKRLKAIQAGKIKSTISTEYNGRLKKYLDSLIAVPKENYHDYINKMLNYYNSYAEKDYKKAGSVLDLPPNIRKWMDDPSTPMPDEIMTAVQLLFKKTLKTMNAMQLNEIIKNIKNIKETGRTILEQEEAERLERLNETASKIAEQINKTTTIKIEDDFIEAIKRNNKSKFNYLGKLGKKYFWSIIQPQRMIEWLVGWKNVDLIKSQTIEKLYEAEGNKLLNIHKAKEEFEKRHNGIDWVKAMRESFMRIDLKETFERNKVQYTYGESNRYVELTLDNMMFIYANSINSGNLAHFRGMFADDKIADDIINQVIKKLPSEYKKVVHSQIKYYDDIQWERINKIFEKEMKVELPKEANYFPIQNIKTNHAVSAIVADWLARTSSMYASVFKGHVKPRVHSKAPFRELSYFNAVTRNIYQVEHYIAYNDAVREVQQLLRHPLVRKAIENKSQEVYNQLDRWLRHIAVGKVSVEYDSIIGKAFDFIRRNFAVFAIGLKLTTGLMQITSLFKGIASVDKDNPLKPNVLKSVFAFLANPVLTEKFVDSKSPHIKYRSDNVEREIREMWERSERESYKKTMTIPSKLKSAMMWHVKKIDKVVCVIIWNAKFNEEMEKHGSEERAIRAADEVIRRTQSFGNLILMPSIYVGGGVERAFTIFTSDLNQNINLAFEIIGKWSVQGTKQNINDVFWNVFMSVTAVWLINNAFQPVLTAIKKARGEGEGEEDWRTEEWLKEFVSQYSGGFVFLGILFDVAIASAVDKIKEARGIIPDTRWKMFIDNVSPAGADIITGTTKWIKDNSINGLFESLSICFGVPYRNIKRLYEGIKENIENEDKDWRKLFWSNYRLRNECIYDSMSRRLYKARPNTDDLIRYKEWYESLDPLQKKEFNNYAKNWYVINIVEPGLENVYKKQK